jgi:hypothetical protein
MFDDIIGEMIIEEKESFFRLRPFIFFSTFDIFKVIVVLRLSCSFIFLNNHWKKRKSPEIFTAKQNDQKSKEDIKKNVL